MGTELEELGRGLARELQNHQDAPLSEHIDLAAAKLGIAGADSEEGLNGVVCDGTNLRIHTTSRKLITTESVSRQKEDAWNAKTHVVQLEEFGGQALGQVLLDTSLLASQKLSHFLRWEGGRLWGGREDGGAAECSHLTTWRNGGELKICPAPALRSCARNGFV